MTDETCRSGDGCNRTAVRGYHGLWWCEKHGEQLERVAGLVDKKRAKAAQGGGQDEDEGKQDGC